MNRLIEYFRESIAELKKVVWPSRKQTKDHTIMVIAVSIGIALFLGLIDLILERFVLFPLL
ncbi:MAG: preprotein translocase subunit SecE [Patescibacteria group bacterium]